VEVRRPITFLPCAREACAGAGIRAVPVGEAMVAIVLADHLLRQRTLEG
jgi:chorismate synthase